METIITQAHKLALTQPIDDSHLTSLYTQDPFPYLRFLYYVGKLSAAKTAIELGTCTGRGTAHLAAACEWVFTVDPELHDAFAENTAPYPNITYLPFRSDDRRALDVFMRGSIDLCFVDSVHAADYAMREVELWTPKMRPGGLFLFDDLDLMPSLPDRLPFKGKGYLDGLHIEGFGYAIV